MKISIDSIKNITTNMRSSGKSDEEITEILKSWGYEEETIKRILHSIPKNHKNK